MLTESGAIYEEEVGPVKEVLRAAALTYVAGLVMAVLQLHGRAGNRNPHLHFRPVTCTALLCRRGQTTATNFLFFIAGAAG